MDLKELKKFKKEQSKVFKEDVETHKATTEKSAVEEDTRFFNITQNELGEGQVTLRFLPALNRKLGSYVKLTKHNTNRNGKFINVVCPRTFGKDKKCPICEYRNSIWNENEKLARYFTNSYLYITNILIVKDKVNPENEGKVFLFRFGNQLFKFIEEQMKEENDYRDLDEGFNFTFKIRKIDTTINGKPQKVNDYTLSSFSDAQTPICKGNEEEQLRVLKSMYDLGEFLDEGKLLTYDQLQEKLDKFMSASAAAPKSAEDKVKEKLEQKKAKPPVDDDDDEPPFEVDKKKPSSDDDDEDDVDFDSLLGDDD